MLRKMLTAAAAITLASTGLLVGHALSQQTAGAPPGPASHDLTIRATKGAKKLLVQDRDAIH